MLLKRKHFGVIALVLCSQSLYFMNFVITPRVVAMFLIVQILDLSPKRFANCLCKVIEEVKMCYLLIFLSNSSRKS